MVCYYHHGNDCAYTVGIHLGGNIQNFAKMMNDKAKELGIKVYFDTTISEVTDVTPLKEICEFARKRNLKVHVQEKSQITEKLPSSLKNGIPMVMFQRLKVWIKKETPFYKSVPIKMRNILL